MEIGVLSGNLLSFLPHEACLALQRLPVELDELGRTVISHEAISVDTEAVDMSEGAGDTVSSHGPEQGVKRTWLLAEEIPSRVVS